MYLCLCVCVSVSPAFQGKKGEDGEGQLDGSHILDAGGLRIVFRLMRLSSLEAVMPARPGGDSCVLKVLTASDGN